LCGDFNLQPETKSLAILEKGMRNLIKEFNIDTTRNYLYDHKEKYADYFLVSPEVKILSFKVIDTLVSDHLPLVLEFE
jgi:endonuclease/exonuclease/phosphatase family metal-dependent hydrolase